MTGALARCKEGDIIGFRGPYGNVFPIEDWKGKNLLFIAGGIALPPLRCVIWNALDTRENFKDITIVYGARTVADLVYKNNTSTSGNSTVMTPPHPSPQHQASTQDRQGNENNHVYQRVEKEPEYPGELRPYLNF